jgi:hypothetical protein
VSVSELEELVAERTSTGREKKKKNVGERRTMMMGEREEAQPGAPSFVGTVLSLVSVSVN